MPEIGQNILDVYNSTVVTPFVDYDALTNTTQPQAYDYVVEKLGIGDLRAAYANLNINLSTYYTILSGLTCPSVVQPDDWSTVQGGIEEEMQAVLNTQALFDNIGSFVQDVFLSDTMIVNSVGNMVSAESNDSTTASVLSFLSDVLWALSSIGAVDAPLGVLFNVGSALFSAVSAGVGGGVSDVQAAYSQLQFELNGQFENIITANGDMENAFLTDWGKLQSINSMITTGILVWPADTSTGVTAASIAYEIGVFQVLLPLHYGTAASIYEHNSDDAKYSESSCACVCMQQNGWAVAYTPQYGGGYQAYWILYGSLKWWDPPTDACNRLFGYLGVSIYDVVNSAGSWSVLTQGIAYSDDPSCVPKH